MIPNVVVNDKIVEQATVEKIKDVALNELGRKKGDPEVSKSVFEMFKIYNSLLT